MVGRMMRMSLCAAVVAGAMISLPVRAQDASPGEIAEAMEVADSLSLAFEHAGAVVSPAVVTVRSATRVTMDDRVMVDPFADSPLREFFGDEFFRRFQGVPRQQGGHRSFVRRGQGTGFIVDSDGLVLTNNHVVDGATEVEVQLADGREFRAEIVGTDPSTDLALLRIDAGGLPTVRWGDSEDLRPGEWVVAVGNPFGLTSTITAGIVSATGRSRVGIADYEDFIQTDAAINPGNSGGPLVNLRGEVVGVNTAIASRNGGNLGVGFAIPSNLARDIMERLATDGKVTRGWLGVMIQDLNEGLSESFGFEGTDGVLIGEVLDGGPAASGGLMAGDIVTAFNGEKVSSLDDFRMMVAQTRPGTTVPVRVFRDGEWMTLRVTIGTREDEAGGGPAPEQDETLGMELRDLDEQTAEELGVEDGVLVSQVDPLGDASRSGLRAGDVITHVNGKRVRSVSQLRRMLREADLSKGVRLRVRTDGAQRFVFLRTG